MYDFVVDVSYMYIPMYMLVIDGVRNRSTLENTRIKVTFFH